MHGGGYSGRRSLTTSSLGSSANYFGSTVNSDNARGSGGAGTGSTNAVSSVASSLAMTPISNSGFCLPSSNTRRSARHSGLSTHFSSSAISSSSGNGSQNGMGVGTGSSLTDDGQGGTAMDINDNGNLSNSGWNYNNAYAQQNLGSPNSSSQGFYNGGTGLTSQSNNAFGSPTGHGHSSHSHSHLHGSHSVHSHSHSSSHHHHHHHHSQSSMTSSGAAGALAGTSSNNNYINSDTSYFPTSSQQMVTRSAAAGMAAQQSSLSSHHASSASMGASGAYGSSSPSASMAGVGDFGFSGSASNSGAGAYAAYSDSHLSASGIGGNANAYASANSNKRKKLSYVKEPKREQFEDDRFTDPGDDRKSKQRATKACDKCREQKCKCVPDPEHPSTCAQCFLLGVACTFRGPSHKRGPPKGYLSAVISRLEAMENTILGKLAAHSDDQRARALLRELIGDVALGQVLSGRLKLGDRTEPNAFSPAGSSTKGSYATTSPVKKGSGPNGTTWQDTWWVSTSGVPNTSSKTPVSRTRFGGSSTDSGHPNMIGLNHVSSSPEVSVQGGNNLGLFTDTNLNESSQFQPSDDLSPRTGLRSFPASTAPAANQGQGAVDWQNQHQPTQENLSFHQSQTHQTSERHSLTQSSPTFTVHEYGHDLVSFWQGVKDTRRVTPDLSRPTQLSLVSHGSPTEVHLTLEYSGHLHRLIRAVTTTTPDHSSFDRGTKLEDTFQGRHSGAYSAERPAIKRDVCYLQHSEVVSGTSQAMNDTLQVWVSDEAAIHQYFTGKLHMAFPIIHFQYYQQKKIEHEDGKKVMGLKDVDIAMTHLVKAEKGETFDSTSYDSHLMAHSVDVRYISKFKVAALLLLTYKAFRQACYADAAGLLSVATVWAQQLGLHRLTDKDAPTDAIDYSRQSSQMIWSGCIVLNTFLNIAGTPRTLPMHPSKLVELEPFLADSDESTRAAFHPLTTLQNAEIALTNLASWHTLCFLIEESIDTLTMASRYSRTTAQGLLTEIDRRLAKWSSLATSLLSPAPNTSSNDRYNLNRLEDLPQWLNIQNSLMQQHSIMFVNSQISSIDHHLIPSQAAKVIIDEVTHIQSLPSSEQEHIISQPWCILSVFAAGVEVYEAITASEDQEAKRNDLYSSFHKVKDCLASYRHQHPLAAHYDDVLSAAQLPSSSFKTTVRMEEDDDDDGEEEDHETAAGDTSGYHHDARRDRNDTGDNDDRDNGRSTFHFAHSQRSYR
ncbi:unnamed protein product [Sympodiomycopsis kandeliae]